MHILQLCPRVPFPPHDGGAIAMYDVAAGLARAGHRVTVLAANTPKHRQPADALAHLGPLVRLETVDVDTDLSPWAALKNLALSQQPYNVERFVSPALAARLLALVQAGDVDIIQCEGTFVAWYAEWLHRHHAASLRVPPLVLRAHNVEHTIWQMLARRTANPFKRWYLQNMAARLERFERRHLRQFDAVAAITDDDARRLRALGCPEPVVFVPAGADLARLAPDPARQPQPRTLFLLGSLNWLPNLEGLEWLLREVWPRFRAEFPDVTLHVAGSGAPATLLQAPPAGVIMHGFVESAPDFMQTYDLMLVPLLSGGGMRVKIIEGMALGKAILSTPLGAEGIAARDGANLLLRTGADAWLDALRAWATGQVDTAGLGREAARTARDLYDNARVVQRFEALYQRLLAPAPAGTPAHADPRLVP